MLKTVQIVFIILTAPPPPLPLAPSNDNGGDKAKQITNWLNVSLNTSTDFVYNIVKENVRQRFQHEIFIHKRQLYRPLNEKNVA